MSEPWADATRSETIYGCVFLTTSAIDCFRLDCRSRFQSGWLGRLDPVIIAFLLAKRQVVTSTEDYSVKPTNFTADIFKQRCSHEQLAMRHREPCRLVTG